MATEVSSYKNECYTVAWICALHIEQRAARLMLDNEHGRPQYVHEADQNAYVLGECHGHLVVIVVLPSGSMGTTPAATTATSLRFSFTNIKYSLMVGIGGGIPGPQTQNPVPDIRLGDVVIGHPEGTSCGVVQYDRGKSVGERFERVGSLNPPPVELMSAVATVRSGLRQDNLFERVIRPRLHSKNISAKDRRQFRHQGSTNDNLYRIDYDHADAIHPCQLACDPYKVVYRDMREDGEENPLIHYGTIASGNLVVKSAAMREQIRRDTNAMCVEMEAAGLLHSMQFLVIRGICDYSDTHKNKDWQPYAAITAAAYATELLSVMTPGTPRQQHDDGLHLKNASRDSFDAEALQSRLKQASHERNSLRSISRSHAVIRKRESLPAVAHWQEQQSEHRPHPTTTQSFPVAHKLSEFTGLSEAHSRHTLVDHYSEAASQSLPQLPQGTDRSSPQYSPPILDRHPRMSAIHASSAHVTRPNSTPNLRAAMDSNLAFVKESQNTRSSTLLADPTPAFRIAGYEASGAVSNSHIAELSIPDPADFIYEAQGDAGFDMYGPSRNFANLTIVDEPGDYENGPVKERQTLEHDTSPFQDGRQTLEMGYVQQENPIVELDASEPYRGAPKTPEPDFSNPVSWEAPYPSPYPNQSYKVAWYCEQPYNHGAALLMLDRIHGRPQTCHPWDVYNYVLGEACGHNIIVVYRKQDTDVAAGKPDGLVIESRAGWVGRIFPNICVSFELGVAGALAGPAVDESSIRLGDVVLGSLRDSVMTYWVPTLNEEKKTLRILRVHDGYNFTEELLQDIQSKPGAKRNLRENVILPQLHRLVEQVCPGNPEMLESCRKIWDTPGPENDVLQLSGYQHRSNSAMIPSTIETVAPTPNTFDWTRFEFPQQDQVIVRNPRKMLFVNNNPAIHFGTILAPIYNHNPTVRNWEVQVLKEVNWEFVRQATLAKCADIFDTRHLNLSELQGKRVYENCIAIRGISGYCSMPRLGTDDGGEYDGTVTMEDRWRNYASAAAAAMARYMLKDHISPINIEKYAIKVAPAEPTSFRRKMLAKGQAKQAKMMEKLNLSSRGNC